MVESANLMGTETKENRYIPAMGLDFLTPLYDPITRLMGAMKVKKNLIAVSEIKAGHRVLDIGCGTGKLLEMIKKNEPNAKLVGLDGDPKILKIAKEKTNKMNLEIQFDRGMAYELPYPDNSFDRVLSSLVFHHLNRTNKQRTFREILRVLRPDGLMMIADLGPAQNNFTRLLTKFAMKKGFVSDNFEGLLTVFAKDAGFIDVKNIDHCNKIFGTVWIFRGKKAA
jgi:ubiquinone/menaquinone biosynthesis C-methylase UbiE